jgi:hypothetical protein
MPVTYSKWLWIKDPLPSELEVLDPVLKDICPFCNAVDTQSFVKWGNLSIYSSKGAIFGRFCSACQSVFHGGYMEEKNEDSLVTKLMIPQFAITKIMSSAYLGNATLDNQMLTKVKEASSKSSVLLVPVYSKDEPDKIMYYNMFGVEVAEIDNKEKEVSGERNNS